MRRSAVPLKLIWRIIGKRKRAKGNQNQQKQVLGHYVGLAMFDGDTMSVSRWHAWQHNEINGPAPPSAPMNAMSA